MMSLLPIVLFLSLNIDTSRGQQKDNDQIISTTKASSRLYDPNYGFEPYWPGGDWVLGVDQPTTLATSTQVMICGEDCPDNYRELGEVCILRLTWKRWEFDQQQCPSIVALRYFHIRWDGTEHMFGSPGINTKNSWRCAGLRQFNEDIDETYMTMDTYCDFLSKQCHQNKIGPKFEYMLVHLGRCLLKRDVDTEFPEYTGDNWMELFQSHFDNGKHVQRVDFWAQSVKERLSLLKQTPFVPHRWPQTTSSLDSTTKQAATAARPLLREGVPDQKPPEQEPPALSQVLEAWQDYLRVLR